MKISILPGSSTGTPVYVETHTATTNANGLVNLEIGDGAIVSGNFTGIDWSSGLYFIKTDTDPTGGTNYTVTGTSQLLSVPYALYANSSAGDLATRKYIDDALKTLGLIPNNYSGTVADIEGNLYKTVMIGTQTWMSENLRTQKFNDGGFIPIVSDQFEWVTTLTPALCSYDNNRIYFGVYGALYNWYAVNTGKLCPSGWHVPTQAEWHALILTLDANALENFAPESTVAGNKLKEKVTIHWLSSDMGVTNESGFTAFPGGYRNAGLIPSFVGIGSFSLWWSTNEENNAGLGLFLTGSNGDTIDNDPSDKATGISVRCIKVN